MTGPKEIAYDEQIAPLMAQIIALCKEHKINMAAQFALDANEDDGEPLFCTTCLPVDKKDEIGHERIVKLGRVMKPSPQFAAFTIIGGAQ